MARATVGRPSFRDSIKQWSPKWLQTGYGEKLLYACALTFDALNEKMRQAMYLHIPTYGDSSALPFIGADRLLTQGPGETSAQFAARCRLAYDDWQHAGSAWSVMRQLLNYLTPLSPQIRIIDDEATIALGDWHTYIAGASTLQTPPSVVNPVAAFNWDGAQYYWWRSWIVIQSTGWTSTEGTWGDGDLWGDATKSWGLSVPNSTIVSIQSLVQLWKAAHCSVPWIIISFDSTLFDPAQPSDGVRNPNGTFGTWGVITGGVEVASRFANARYVDGVT